MAPGSIRLSVSHPLTTTSGYLFPNHGEVATPGPRAALQARHVDDHRDAVPVRVVRLLDFGTQLEDLAAGRLVRGDVGAAHHVDAGAGAPVVVQQRDVGVVDDGLGQAAVGVAYPDRKLRWAEHADAAA